MVLAAACGGGSGDTLTIYTSVTQATVDAVVAGFEQDSSDATVEVFRAPTGEVVARVEAERRNGTVGADVIWLSDPLSMLGCRSDGMLSEWEPTAASGLPSEVQTPRFWGTRVLHLVIVTRAGNPFDLEAWSDLVDPSLAVASPIRASPALPSPPSAISGSSTSVSCEVPARCKSHHRAMW